MTFEIKKKRNTLTNRELLKIKKKNLTSLFNRWYEQIFK